ncbi:FAD-dependent oxidoreductase [Oryzihumus sp.]
MAGNSHAQTRDAQTRDVDVVVIGSGFGGSVTALRLSEKGYRVAVLEMGRRFTQATLPKTSWNVRRFLWAPRIGLHGMQRIHVLKDVVVLAGAGVGGGSLVYANTLYEAPQPFYDDPQWAHITDWRDELAPYYDQASRMLGVTPNPTVTPQDRAMKQVAERMGVGDTFRLAPVGVFFGREGRKEPGTTVPDPFFGGLGPDRQGCLECGECMIGCRHGAKNRLDLNYLAMAERAGARVYADTTVTKVRPLSGGGYAVDTVRTGRWRTATADRTFTADHVVFAAGAWGTQRLLHELRDTGVLPRLSERLGHLTRTNSEALVGATARGKDVDYTEGVAITSSFFPDHETHIEPVHYGKGSNVMGLLATTLVDGGGRVPRWAKLVGSTARHPGPFLRRLSVRGWSERTVIALTMQTLDNSIVVSRRGSRVGPRLTSRQGHGHPNPTWIPAAHEAARMLAQVIGGDASGSWADVGNVPMTAHLIGGCPIGESAETGVVDPYQRLYGYDGLHVVDGSAVSANLGVNPSLTITAQAERAMALWPNKGEPDPRPAVGEPYVRVEAVAPRHPVVPAHAPAALRLVSR